MIGFAGLSHLGIVSSVAAASRGHDVVAYDPAAALIAELEEGRLPVTEPGLLELRQDAGSRLRFTATAADLGSCDVVYVSVDVPTEPDGRSDAAAVDRLLEDVVPRLAPEGTLVILSQVRPGFTRALATRLTQSHPTVRVYYQVETLVFGRAVERALHPERYIVGAADPDRPLPAPYVAFLAAWGCPILVMRYESAELAKISINMFLVSSIAVTNTLAEICEVIGADWAEIAPALRLDRRIGPHAYLAPGLGIAGGNLERDLATVRNLAFEHGVEAGVVDAWATASRYRRDWVLKVLHTELIRTADDPVIAVWGLAYKADTKSTKNSPSLALLDALRPFAVQAYDPVTTLDGTVVDGRVLICPSAWDACHDADALAIMTPWAEFGAVDIRELRRQLRGRVLIDPFRVLDGRRCVAEGFRYFTLGAPAGMPERVA